MTNFINNLDQSIGRFAVQNPVTWVYSFVFSGIALNLLVLGGLGYALGMAFQQGTYGMYIGLAIYAYWFSSNLDSIKDMADAQIEVVKNLGQ